MEELSRHVKAEAAQGRRGGLASYGAHPRLGLRGAGAAGGPGSPAPSGGLGDLDATPFSSAFAGSPFRHPPAGSPSSSGAGGGPSPAPRRAARRRALPGGPPNLGGYEMSPGDRPRRSLGALAGPGFPRGSPGGSPGRPWKTREKPPEDLEFEVTDARRILQALALHPHDAALLGEFRGSLKRIRAARKFWRPARQRSWRAEDLDAAAEVAPLPIEWERLLWRVHHGPRRLVKAKGARLVESVQDTRRALKQHLVLLQNTFDAYRDAEWFGKAAPLRPAVDAAPAPAGRASQRKGSTAGGTGAEDDQATQGDAGQSAASVANAGERQFVKVKSHEHQGAVREGEQASQFRSADGLEAQGAREGGGGSDSEEDGPASPPVEGFALGEAALSAERAVSGDTLGQGAFVRLLREMDAVMYPVSLAQLSRAAFTTRLPERDPYRPGAEPQLVRALSRMSSVTGTRMRQLSKRLSSRNLLSVAAAEDEAPDGGLERRKTEGGALGTRLSEDGVGLAGVVRAKRFAKQKSVRPGWNPSSRAPERKFEGGLGPSGGHAPLRRPSRADAVSAKRLALPCEMANGPFDRSRQMDVIHFAEALLRVADAIFRSEGRDGGPGRREGADELALSEKLDALALRLEASLVVLEARKLERGLRAEGEAALAQLSAPGAPAAPAPAPAGAGAGEGDLVAPADAAAHADPAPPATPPRDAAQAKRELEERLAALRVCAATPGSETVRSEAGGEGPCCARSDSVFQAFVSDPDVAEVLETGEPLLRWVFTFMGCHNPVDREVPEGAPGVLPAEGCTASFNDLLHHLLICDMVSKEGGVTAGVVARAFQDATGQEVAVPRVHPANQGLEMTLDEFLETLLRVAARARPLGDDADLALQLDHILNNEAVGLVPASERVIGAWQAMEPLPTYGLYDY